jgi:hypothetical protein
LGHRTERFRVETKRHRRKLDAKRFQRVDHARGGQQHVQDKVDFCLEAAQKASDLGAEATNSYYGARLRQDRAASFGQLGLRVVSRSKSKTPSCASRLAIE